MENRYLKSRIKLFLKLNPIVPKLGISKKILCILVAQETAKLSNLKVGGQKKLCCSVRCAPYACSLGLNQGFFFVSQTLISASFAAP